MPPAPNNPSRRPVPGRDRKWATGAANRLTSWGISPNAVSVLGMVAAVGAGLASGASATAAPGWTPILAVTTILLCAGRLACNLLDGLMAVEGGRGTATGPFWNEAPDRISDWAILVGVGIAAGAPTLGWGAACGALLTAYLRELGGRLGLDPDFRGPMGKPARMVAIMIAAAVVAVAAMMNLPTAPIWESSLWVVVIGTVLTAGRRTRHILQSLGPNRENTTNQI